MIIEEKKTENGRGRYKGVPTPPDGGWGWWVVFSSFWIHVVADGIAYTFGLFLVEIEKEMHTNKSDTSWIASVMAGITYGIGPIAGAIVNRFGCRAVSAAGSVIAAFGFSISYFAQSLLFLYISIGLIGGLGLGFIYLPAIVCVTCYFEKRRAFATGIAVCGSGFGTFLLAPFIEWIISEIGWRHSLLVTGAIILSCFFFSLFFRPLLVSDRSSEDGDLSGSNVPMIIEPDENSDASKPLMKDPNNAIDSPTRKGNRIGTPDEPLNLKRPCSQPALRLQSTDSLPHMVMMGSSPKRCSLGLKQFGSTTGLPLRSPAAQAHKDATASGVILQRKDIFYSGSLMKIPGGDYNSNSSNGNLGVLTLSPTLSAMEKDYDQSVVDRRMKEGHQEDNNGGDVKNDEPFAGGFRNVFKAMMDFRILRDPIFLFFAISNFFTSIGYNVPYIYLYDKAIGEDEKNPINDKLSASFLLSIVGISNTLSRVALGYLSDKPWVNRLYLYNCALTICGIATGLCSHTDDINLLRLYSATFGATVGVYVSLTSVILVDLLGLEKLTNAFGLLLLFQGIATVIGPPIVGKLFDEFGDYRYGFWLAGGMIALSGLMLFLVPLIKRKTATGEGTKTNEMDDEHIVIHCPGDNKGRGRGSNNNLSI